MSIAVRMPGLDLWKAQVRCQAVRPVAPECGAGLLAASVLLWTAVPEWLSMPCIGRTDI